MARGPWGCSEENAAAEGMTRNDFIWKNKKDWYDLDFLYLEQHPDFRAFHIYEDAKDGCPWDKVQTHDSLKAGCIEEAVEVIGGINILKETGDSENLKEELGDLLLQVMFHAVMAEEEGLFTFEDVAKAISDKMVRRHPHVFGDMKFATEEELHGVWAEIKRKEKEGKEWQAEYLPGAFKEAQELIQTAKCYSSQN